MAQLKLHMSLADQRWLPAYKPTLDRLGVEVTPFKAGVDGVLPLYDASASTLGGHPCYMPQASLDKILNKERLGETGLPTLPTTVIALPEAAPAGTLVKPRNSVTGGWVYQPHVGFPLEDLDIHFSVNSAGKVFVLAAERHEFLAAKKPGRLRMALPEEAALVVENISAACQRLEIRGGVHEIQFLQYEGQWCAVDWNPRPPMVYSEGIANKYPCLDGALAHMLGLPAPQVAAPVFINRAYWDRPIPLTKWAIVESFGLLPRLDYFKSVRGIVRVNGVGASADEVNAKFDVMEAAL